MKPRDCVMPYSKALVARCGKDGKYKYVQLSAAGTTQLRSIRKIIRWLKAAEKWMGAE